MDFKELIMGRYATKKFDGRKIDDETLDQILEMVRFSPSALNIQPWKIKVIADNDLKAKLSPASMDQAQIKTCSHLLVFCANTDLKGNAKKLVNGLNAAGIPQENVEQYQRVLDNFINIFASNELCEAQNNVFIAATTVLYAAKSVGVDSCPMQGFDPKAYMEILELPSNLIPTIIVPMGYPADEQMPKNRFPKEEIFF
ncbi:MAG: NAD(P)H-dependent oxidoreductase [Methanobacterium paludis]|uniref:Nitroreductase n=1 Tax=Methanobacterium paludis (strain DSM 25820 / JCM 18151 / SWAN1) TaxID=868131 RepID=F6D5A9_METPW|nr:NAD(P)H-dependent oxidoreductase [Methanobacterium paludis]AEG18217.1 nitroreductase [Methanobacterium paludis]MCE7698199.1 NAD(P)H-dependent oxidoreductase [Methanobacterium paludis]